MICLSSKSTPTYVDQVFVFLPFKPFFLYFLQTTFTFWSKTGGWSRGPWCTQNTFNICHCVKWLCSPANEMSQMFENCLALHPPSKNAFPFLIWSSTVLYSFFPLFFFICSIYSPHIGCNQTEGAEGSSQILVVCSLVRE